MRFGRERTIAAAALVLLACADPGDDSAAHGAAGAAGGSSTDAAVAAGPWTALAERPCPTHSDLSYESFGAPFFSNWCQGCHGSARAEGERQGAPLLVRFDDLAAVRLHAAAIWRRAADENATMPPVGGPPPETRAQLGQWLACGAPARADLR